MTKLSGALVFRLPIEGVAAVDAVEEFGAQFALFLFAPFFRVLHVLRGRASSLMVAALLCLF